MTEFKELFLIDTNVLIYAYEEKESEKRTRAIRLIKECFSGKIKLAISSQNLAEFSSAFLTKGKGNIEKISLVVKDIINCENFIKLDYTRKTVLFNLSLLRECPLPYWDSLIIATMRENGIFNIYTENVKDFKVAGIRAVNPLG